MDRRESGYRPRYASSIARVAMKPNQRSAQPSIYSHAFKAVGTSELILAAAS